MWFQNGFMAFRDYCICSLLGSSALFCYKKVDSEGIETFPSRAAEQIIGREGETATFLSIALV